jgi:5'-3' exonuclease
MAELNGHKDVDIEVDLLRHMVINTIRSHYNKFKGEYGELVIACDSKKYWRKDHFPYYKANRKKLREESGYNWNLIFDTINLLKQELKDVFPYRVLEVTGAEADDIIATLCKWSQTNDLVGNLIEEPQPVLIISGDHDFIQLQKYSNVKQFSPIQKKFVKSDKKSNEVVLEHIIKGDKGDGIPNVLTADDAIVNGDRQKPISSKKLNEWISDPVSMPRDENFLRNFQRNKLLTDLSQIPQEIESQILNTFTGYPTKDKSMLLDYFIEHKMKNMIELIEEF